VGVEDGALVVGPTVGDGVGGGVGTLHASCPISSTRSCKS
jgi:hypothetical protein